MNGVNCQEDTVNPNCTEDKMSEQPPVVVHISSFSFVDNASTHIPPGETLTMQLVAEINNDGFTISGDQLMNQPTCWFASLAGCVPFADDILCR